MIKVDFIPQKRMERRVMEILQKAFDMGIYNMNEATPIQLICEKIFGLRFDYNSFRNFQPDALGCFDFSSNTIFINSDAIDEESEYDVRENYTIGHELGHAVYHGYLYELDPSFVALLHDESSDHSYQKAHDDIECQSNFFSAMILMPAFLVEKKWHEYADFSEHERRDILKDFFKVSREAMSIRLSKLGLFQN